jgi:uncharacterized membrane protein YkvA (DUF1232 family)
MSQVSPSANSIESLGGLLQQIRLGWRLFRDQRVPAWAKVIPAAALIYLLSPIDLMPDMMLPLVGGLDDVAILLLALKAFLDLSPTGLVSEHLEAIMGKKRRAATTRTDPSGETIEAQYHILD